MINNSLKSNILQLLFGFIICANTVSAQITIPIATKDNAIVIMADSNNRLRTIYFGKSLQNENDYAILSSKYSEGNNNEIFNSTYTPSGTWNLSEPAIQIKHADGNSSLDLKYVSHKKRAIRE